MIQKKISGQVWTVLFTMLLGNMALIFKLYHVT